MFLLNIIYIHIGYYLYSYISPHLDPLPVALQEDIGGAATPVHDVAVLAAAAEPDK